MSAGSEQAETRKLPLAARPMAKHPWQPKLAPLRRRGPAEGFSTDVQPQRVHSGCQQQMLARLQALYCLPYRRLLQVGLGFHLRGRGMQLRGGADLPLSRALQRALTAVGDV